MKIVLHIIILASTLPLVGCIGLGDFKKLPPGADLVWRKPGKTVEEMFIDRQACSDKAREVGIEPGFSRRHFSDACMLEQGYIFTNYRSRDFADYCSKDWYGGGPACKSVGQ